jgi:transcription antitermination factor NusG
VVYFQVVFCSSSRVHHARPPLFPSYLFVLITAGQWYSAQWCVGVIGIIRDGAAPARVPDDAIAAIRARERNGLVELPRKPGLARPAIKSESLPVR